MTGSDIGRAKQAIRESYDHSADGYLEYVDRFVYSHLAVPLAAALKDSGGPVLDVACGAGALGRLLDDVVEIDISHGQLARNPLPLRLVADAETLPFKNKAFTAAGCAFGVNHFPKPQTAVAEMARVATVVGVLTWQRPDEPFAPKEIVLETISAHADGARTEADDLVDEMTQAMGSTRAVEQAMEAAGLVAEVGLVQVEVPWPGADAFVDYRLAMAGALRDVIEADAVRAEAKARIEALPDERLMWRPRLVLGVGRGP